MDKTKLLTFSVIALLLINLGTLGFLFLTSSNSNHPHGNNDFKRRPEPKEIIIKKLNFDSKQISEYEKLIQWHRKEIRSIEENIRATKNELYLQLHENTINSKVKDSLIDALATYQKQIENTHFNHFQDIKKICREDQLDDFNALTEELSRLFSKPHPPRHD
jgi:hypothetical protein